MVAAIDFNVPFEALTDRTAFLEAKTGALFNAANFTGFDPTGVTASTSALQDAIDAAEDAGGGVVDIPAGVVQHGLLTIPGNVSLRGVPDSTFMMFNHATVNALVFTGANAGRGTFVRDLRFLGSVAATGDCVRANAPVRVLFDRCSWNGETIGGAPSANLQGRLLGSADAGADFIFRDCDLRVAGDVNGLVSTGRMLVHGGAITMPATYSQTLVSGAGVEHRLHNVIVDATAYTTGTPDVILTSSGTNWVVTGCSFRGPSQLGVIAMRFGAPNSRMVESGNRYSGFPRRYGGFMLDPSSSLDKEPYGVGVTAGASFIIDPGFRAFLIRAQGLNMAVTLPPGLFPGEEFSLLVYAENNALTPTLASTSVTGTVLPTITTGQVLTGRFVWHDAYGTGTYRWVQIGDWGVGSNLVA